MCALLGDTVFTSAVGGVSSIVYLFPIPTLSVPAVAILLLLTVTGILLQAHITRKWLGISAELNGRVFRFFFGIQKIKLAGAERRAFVKWAEIYAKDAALRYNLPLLFPD